MGLDFFPSGRPAKIAEKKVGLRISFFGRVQQPLAEVNAQVVFRVFSQLTEAAVAAA